MKNSRNEKIESPVRADRTFYLNESENISSNECFPEESLLELALEISARTIASGGEANRAEEAARKILISHGAENCSAVVLPTMVMLSADFKQKTYIKIKNIKNRSFDLGELDRLNSVSRALAAHSITPEKAYGELKNRSSLSNFCRILFSALSGGFFAFMLGGGAVDFICAGVASALCSTIIDFFEKRGIYPFAACILCSALVTLISRYLFSGVPGSSMEIIIIGAIMPLLPGLSLTNAVRDSLNGDLVSGAARFLEALLTAICIAAGVGVSLAV